MNDVKGSRDDGTSIFGGAGGRRRGSGIGGGHGRGGGVVLLGDVGIYVLWMCGVRPTVHVAINDQISWPTIEGEVRGSTKPTGFLRVF